MLSGKATLASAIEAVNTGGISRFLLKPCNPIALAVAIREGLQQHALMAAAYRLLQKNKRQSEIINKLEQQFPDISKVERDADGAIRLDDFHGDIDLLLAEMNEHLGDERPLN
jgi:two-component system, probable response regulator PhcQ